MVVLSDREERARVKSRIGSLILEFCHFKFGTFADAEFYMEELRGYVERRVRGTMAPDSPGRILRQLRQQRQLNYRVISRSKSLYRVVPVERPAEQAELFYEKAS
ncbi:hypothetical protein LCGC14_2293130 [marine sediment metagenome]|uniref:Uncharacterized protein n=1 Tax=marine sediment metagenome TaxID=412755 RepID=A0A0F9FKT4_9ZZZZ